MAEAVRYSDENGQVVYRIGNRVILSTVMYPFTYAKTLMQLGYEPVSPKVGKNIFGGSALYNPNIFSYLKYLKNRNGITSWWTGASYNIAATIITCKVEDEVLRKMRDINDENASEDTKLVRLRNKTCNAVAASCAGRVVTRPLVILATRCIAQTVGNEGVYSSNPINGISAIWREEGIFGFFAGLPPVLLYTTLNITLCNVFKHLFDELIQCNEELQKATKDQPFDMSQLAASLITSQLVYPLDVIGTNSAIANSKLFAARFVGSTESVSWLQTTRQLRALNGLRWGEKMVLRRYESPLLTKTIV